MSEITLQIDGMHCGACIKRASQALASTDGLTVKEVRVGAARIETTGDPGSADRAIAALAKVGYPAHLEQIGESESATARK
jgi:copper chaperone CopZ